MPKFTKTQGQYLAFIDAYTRVHGRAPAEADFEGAFGVTAPSVHQMILTLERKGLITRVPGTARSIELSIPTADLPPLGDDRTPRPGRSTKRQPRNRKPAARSKPDAQRPARPDPADEYVDSSLMDQRLRYGKQLSARIAGRYGVYRTRARLTRRVDGDCTCPSDPWPCKHVRALLATWTCNPASFFDLGVFLKSLATRTTTELVKSIGEIAVTYPPVLGLLGVEGFAGDDDDLADAGPD